MLTGDIWVDLLQDLLKFACAVPPGDDTGVIVSISVHGGCDEKLVQLSPLFATATSQFLSSASKILSLGCEIDMKPTHSVLHHTNGERATSK